MELEENQNQKENLRVFNIKFEENKNVPTERLKQNFWKMIIQSWVS